MTASVLMISSMLQDRSFSSLFIRNSGTAPNISPIPEVSESGCTYRLSGYIEQRPSVFRQVLIILVVIVKGIQQHCRQCNVYETPSKCPQRMRLKRFTYPDRTLQVGIEKGYNTVHLFCRITMSKEVHRQFASICRTVSLSTPAFNPTEDWLWHRVRCSTARIIYQFNQCFSSIFQVYLLWGVRGRSLITQWMLRHGQSILFLIIRLLLCG